MGDITPHFSRSEFALTEAKARRYGFSAAEYPQEWVETRLRPLCRALEVLRERLGGPKIVVISGYRTPAYNTAINGAQDSQHMAGRAADIKVQGVHPDRVADMIEELYHIGAIEIGGVGRYDTFTHIDVRGGALHRWDERNK